MEQEYILQVTPKKIEFKSRPHFVKVTTSLFFGDLEFKSPYARFIRSNQCTFYGERLKLHNHIKQQGFLAIYGISRTGQEELIAKISLDLISSAEEGQVMQLTFQDQIMKFSYEIQVLERELSDNDLDNMLGEQIDNQHFTSEPILQDIMDNNASGIRDRIPNLNLDRSWDHPKEIELPETPRLFQDGPTMPENSVISDPELSLPPEILLKTSQHAAPMVSLPHLNIETHPSSPKSTSLEKVSSPKSPGVLRNSQIHKGITSPKSQSRVKFSQDYMRTHPSSTSARRLVAYLAVSIGSFCLGMYVKKLN